MSSKRIHSSHSMGEYEHEVFRGKHRAVRKCVLCGSKEVLKGTNHTVDPSLESRCEVVSVNHIGVYA